MALIKIYRRPRCLNDHLAERSRDLLSFLGLLHVGFSCLFLLRSALITRSLGGAGAPESMSPGSRTAEARVAGADVPTELHDELKPFTYAFVASLLYMLILLPLSKCYKRNEEDEDTGADALVYQAQTDWHTLSSARAARAYERRAHTSVV